MALPLAAIILGLGLLIWSADRFIDGAAGLARQLGMPPLLIGMAVVGFGTSAPEIAVSTLAALDGAPGMALGNAYGSNITNIGLILGMTALIAPISVHSSVLRRELPILLAVTAIAIWLLSDRALGRPDATVLLLLLLGFLGWTLVESMRGRDDILGAEVDLELAANPMSTPQATLWLVIGLAALVASSRMLVWGAVSIAQSLGISDLIIGLTVVAIGTSLPELASSLIAARKGEHDIVLGNIVGSNLFNTLAVVGIASAIQPLDVPAEALRRDVPVMAALTVALLAVSFGFRGSGRINRIEGGALLLCYCSYNLILARAAMSGA
ncbi:MAG: calcium/sodium antiporter [Porticoccaceae bacterium]|jgi:cation:H+ antiporter|nr:calcium/sodium antiporter [Porticoccaceae bacterium]